MSEWRPTDLIQQCLKLNVFVFPPMAHEIDIFKMLRKSFLTSHKAPNLGPFDMLLMQNKLNDEM